MMKLMMMMFEKKKKKKKEKQDFDCKIEQPLSKKNALVVVRESSWRRQRKKRRFSTPLEEGAARCIIKCMVFFAPERKGRRKRR